jgi:hypothetical protein
VSVDLAIDTAVQKLEALRSEARRHRGERSLRIFGQPDNPSKRVDP